MKEPLICKGELENITLTTKLRDDIKCPNCHKGIVVPFNPKAEINHTFICNACGWSIHLDANVTIE